MRGEGKGGVDKGITNPWPRNTTNYEQTMNEGKNSFIDFYNGKLEIAEGKGPRMHAIRKGN